MKKAMTVSLVIHSVGFAALAAWNAELSTADVKLAGSDQVIELTLSVDEPQWDPDPATDEIRIISPPAVIKPTEARIAERRFVHTLAAKIPAAEFDPNSFVDITAPKVQKKATPEELEQAWESQLQKRTLPLRKTSPHYLPQIETVEPPTSLGNAKDTPPDLSDNAPPTYPTDAILRGWEGTVLLRISIDSSGAVYQVAIKRSSGYPILDSAAAKAVSRWKAIPAQKGGKAVGTIEILPVRFEL